MRIFFNSSNSVTNFYQKPKAHSQPNFGCTCIRTDKIKISPNVQQKLQFRNISIQMLNNAIAKGKAYIDEATKRIMVFYKPKQSEKASKLLVVLSEDKTALITAFPPRGVYKFIENSKGELFQPGTGRRYLPIEKTQKKLVSSEYRNIKLIYDKNNVLVGERTMLDNGYIEKNMSGEITCVKHVEKAVVDGRKVKFQTFYYPQEQQIQHRGERYNPDSARYQTYKRLYFSEYA